jgi:hypothetical protein
MFSLWSISAGAKSAGRRRLESDEFILRRNELIALAVSLLLMAAVAMAAFSLVPFCNKPSRKSALPTPALGERDHRRLARRLVSMRRAFGYRRHRICAAC